MQSQGRILNISRTVESFVPKNVCQFNFIVLIFTNILFSLFKVAYCTTTVLVKNYPYISTYIFRFTHAYAAAKINYLRNIFLHSSNPFEVRGRSNQSFFFKTILFCHCTYRGSLVRVVTLYCMLWFCLMVLNQSVADSWGTHFELLALFS